MKLNMTQEERMSQKETKAVVKALEKGEASKGATIRTLFAGGYSVKEIVTLTGIRYNHIYNVCQSEIYKNGLEDEVSRAREGGTKKAAILANLEAGKTITEVSKEMGCLYNQVWQVAKAAGLTPKQLAQKEGV